MRRILVLVVCLLLAFGSVSPASAALPVEEAGLLEGGQAYEINADSSGGLWISDFGANIKTGEIWRINPPYNAPATVYSVGGTPTDARMVEGNLWWVDYGVNIIGRVVLTSGEYSSWETRSNLPDNIFDGLYASAVDGSGRVWATDAVLSNIYRLTLTSSGGEDELCNYNFPAGGLGSYLVYAAPYLWLGDNSNSRMLRLNVSTSPPTYESWNLPSLSSPAGMVVDGGGNLWYADNVNPVIGKVDPANNLLLSFTVPNNPTTLMVTLENGRIWFTADNSPIIGILNPSTAVYVESELAKTTGTLTGECKPNSRTSHGTIATSPSSISFSTPTAYELDSLGSGLQIYRIPPGDLVDSSPWGIANQGGLMWVVDSGRQKLIKISPPPDIIPNFVYLPLIKR